MMNKAFVKEQDEIVDQCPRCGSTGRTVSAEAFQHHVSADAHGQISQPAMFCPLASCDVIYFDQFGRSVAIDAVKRPIYPKDADAPICSCFGLKREDVELDVIEGVVTRCRGLLEKAKSDAAQCTELAPDGRSCVPEMQRYYFKCHEAHRAAK